MISPIFILGNPRSGTTLLRLMLNNHRNIMIPPECGFVVWWYEKYKHWDASLSRDAEKLANFIDDLMTSRKIDTWNLDPSELREYISREQPCSYSELVSCIYQFFGQSTGREFKRWGDKNNFHVGFVTTIFTIFPNCCFVHIVRDGRDVACSYRTVMRSSIVSKYRPRLPTDIHEVAAEWRANLLKVIKAFDEIGWEKVLEIRYEDLVSYFETELRRLCAYLGEPYDDDMLKYYEVNRIKQLEPAEFLQWKAKTLEKPTDSEVGKFKRELSPAEIRDFNREAGDLLRRYGYR